MKPTFVQYLLRYRKALRANLCGPGPLDALMMARLGKLAREAKVRTIDLAKAHVAGMLENTLSEGSAASKASRASKGSLFFATVLHPGQDAGSVADRKQVRALSAHTVEMAVENTHLREEVARRRDTEITLRGNDVQFKKTLIQAEVHSEQMRELARKVLVAQEEERKKISRDLHEVIAQSLTSLNIRLVALRKEASMNTKSLAVKIAHAQRLVASSTRIIHQFACELRPAVLDDIGLIPALKDEIRTFKAQTGVQALFRAFPQVENMSPACRTVLFRVAQEALNNVAIHAGANAVSLSLSHRKGNVLMELRDNGKSFQPGLIKTKGPARQLGLLGMRERLEMVGGKLQIEADPGHGTRIIATIPYLSS